MGETIINGIIEASQEVVGQLQYAAGYVIKNIDQTYSPTSENAQSGIAVAEAVANIKDIAPEQTTFFDISRSNNMLDASTKKTGLIHIDGKIYTGVSYDNYRYFEQFIPVNAGDKISYQFDYNGTRYWSKAATSTIVKSFARIAAYDIDKNVLSNLGFNQSSSNVCTEYVVPETVAFIRITLTKEIDFCTNIALLNNAEEIVPYEEYGISTATLKPDLLPNSVVTDQTYSPTSESAQSGKAVAEAIEPLSEQVFKYSKTPQDVVINDGYHWINATANTNYKYAHLQVKAGDVITYESNGVYGPINIRFVDAYNGNTRVSDACVNSANIKYIVPDGVDNVYVTFSSANLNGKFYIQRTIEETAVKGMNGLRDYVFKNGVWSVTADTLSANTDLIIAPQIDNKKNCVYDGYAEFSSFISLTLAHGKTGFMSSYLIIDETYIKTYHHNGSTAVLMDTYEHGLTFSDYISVHIDLKHRNRGSVTVRTNGGEFTQSNIYFGGCRDEVTVSGGQDMTNVKGSYYLRDIYADTWIFGDSYLSIGDPSKWTEQLIRMGYTDYLLCGLGGANSVQEIFSFRNLIEKCSPKRICWCLGMNDGDTETAVNVRWKTAYDEVVGVCSSKNIELILATTPNVPNIRHDYKNEIVRASGYRYIDFAKAVNAEAVGATWYTDMLYTDNVHPTELGAKALASRILLDVPEITV